MPTRSSDSPCGQPAPMVELRWRVHGGVESFFVIVVNCRDVATSNVSREKFTIDGGNRR